MSTHGLVIVSSLAATEPDFESDRPPVDFYIRVEHGRLFQIGETGANLSLSPTLLVSSGAVALATAYKLNGTQSNAYIRIAPIHAQQDADMWLPELARLRVWSMRNRNRVEVILWDHAKRHQRDRWYAYSSTKEMALARSASG